MKESTEKKVVPGDGISSIRTTNLFRAINFELYTKPNKVIMAMGLAALFGALGYITYMKRKYEGLGYYAAISEDGTEQYRMKKSKWD